jgi:amino acid adenylation domain-containing protein
MADRSADTGFELSVQQEMLWTREPRGPTPRSQLWAHMPAGAAESDLGSALRSAVGRHEILRTVFRRPVGLRLPLQVVLDDLEPAWTLVDLSTVQDAAAALTSLATAEASAPLEHATGPLLRAALLRLPAGRTILLLTASAAVADTESLAEVAAQVSRRIGEEAFDGELVQYADYAAWQREQLAAGSRPTLAPPVVALPFAAEPGPRGWYSRVAVDGSLAEVALPAGATVEDAWLAAWLLLLSRLTGENDVAVGLLHSSRTPRELAGAVGPYAGVVPVGSALDPEAAFRSLVSAAHDARTAAAAAAEAFPPVVADLPFGFARTVMGALAGHPQPFQLRLVVDGATAAVEFDPVAVGPDQGRAVALRLSALVADLRASPTHPSGRLDVVPAAERRRLLEEVNRTDAPLPAAAGVHELIAEQAARTPDRPAVRAADRSLTYAELDQAANSLAALLRARGVGAGTPVALCLERTSTLVVAILGILKAGAFYLPLNPDHPKARLASQLADSGAPIVLTSSALSGLLPDTAAERVCLDRESARLATPPATAPPVEVGPDRLAYLTYTSGSSGRPKGVAVLHRSLLNYVTAVIRHFGWDAEPRSFGLLTTVSTDLGNTCLFPSLASGGTLDLVPVDTAMDGYAYAQHVADRPIDVLKITPSHLTALLATGGADVLPRARLILGGEACPWPLTDRVRELGTCEVTNHYGPTETTIGSLVHDLDLSGGPRRSGTVPIGRPLVNTRIYILDRHGAPVPTGAPGELHIGGGGVAAGYWNAPEQTVESFVADPFAGSPDALMYRTGDLVRFLPDGAVEFLGRTDDQVKIRGFRVEPEEVGRSLLAHSRIAQVAVLGRPDPTGHQRLVAYVVAAGGRLDGPDIESLRRWVADRLPEHMVPAAWVSLDALPLLANGKLARAELPSPEDALVGTAAAFVPPRTETERQLADIWSEVLRLDRVGVTDDFFALGGHSLLATQVIARIRSVLGVQLPLPSLFMAPTVAGLAELVEERQRGAPADADLAHLLEELEGLSDDEAERLLRRESEPSE